MAANTLQTTPSFYAKVFGKRSPTFFKYVWKQIVCKDYCITHHDDKTCSLPAGKFHIILLGEIEELLQKLDTFCLTYEHVDCLYSLFNYRLSGKSNAKSANVFDNVQRAVSFNQ